MAVKNLLGITLLLSLSCVARADEGGGPQVGTLAPNLIGRTLDDKPYLLKRDIGMPKVIDFFWVKCEPCRAEMPELGKLARRFKGVKFIAVHAEDEPAAAVASFVKSLPDAPPNVVLTQGDLRDLFNYVGLPHTIVLDSNNVVLMNLVGYTQNNMRELTSQLQKMEK